MSARPGWVSFQDSHTLSQRANSITTVATFTVSVCALESQTTAVIVQRTDKVYFTGHKLDDGQETVYHAHLYIFTKVDEAHNQT